MSEGENGHSCYKIRRQHFLGDWSYTIEMIVFYLISKCIISIKRKSIKFQSKMQVFDSSTVNHFVIDEDFFLRGKN